VRGCFPSKTQGILGVLTNWQRKQLHTVSRCRCPNTTPELKPQLQLESEPEAPQSQQSPTSAQVISTGEWKALARHLPSPGWVLCLGSYAGWKRAFQRFHSPLWEAAVVEDGCQLQSGTGKMLGGGALLNNHCLPPDHHSPQWHHGPLELVTIQSQ
jgi:hypothetical protein